MISMETLKQLIRPFCKLGKCIMYHNFGRSYRSGKRFKAIAFFKAMDSYFNTCTHIFHLGTPNGIKQGVPKTCFRVPSENPSDL